MLTNVPQATEYSNQRILTTKQIANAYGTDMRVISKNFTRNKDRYTEGKHYHALEGAEKKDFLNRSQIDDGSKNAKTLYLWTEKGAWLHAKSLNTDKAWEAYEILVDEYYRIAAITKQQAQPAGLINSLWIDRTRLFSKYTKIPVDKFCVFEEISMPFFHIELRGYELPGKAIPDGSVGRRWCDYAREALKLDMSLVENYPHHYPDHRGTINAYIYPMDWLPAFRTWFRTVYIPIHLPVYLKGLKASKEEIKEILKGFGVNPQIEGK